MLDQSELDWSSVAKAKTCKCLVKAASTLSSTARDKDEHASASASTLNSIARDKDEHISG